MNSFFVLLILFQYSLLKEGNNKLIEFYSDPPSTQCFTKQVMKIFFKCITSGFDQPQTFELKFKNINLFKASCTILSDDEDSPSSQRIICEMSLVEYGIPHGLSLYDEPPTIPDVEIKYWERISKILFASCYNDYTYQFTKIANYFISKKDNSKFINIQGTIKKTNNITGEENTELNINPILEIDESPFLEITNCKVKFNGKLEEDKNAKMQCNVTHGKTAIFIYSVPLEHTKNYYVFFDISENVLDLEKNISTFIYSKFWLLIIILLLLF